ncbi:hypothetical protein OE88DRAFT_903568 [Heliocybe sulcata]|uniref:EthD domain-containing protein n=1 Tax=Heliocybe sulcata TaxID=5364 RepID=A0A5C3MMQ4_9AGAM|nr:hypothetical protein OE88DRAFT_903568 [Heliocybe sulcata]
MNTQPTIYRILNFIKRRGDLPEEEFYAHWQNVHAALVAPWAVKHGFVGYTQVATPMPLRETYSTAAPPPFNGPMDYDGYVEWRVSSLEGFVQAFQDPYYQETVEPDERRFIEKKNVVLAGTMGVEMVVVQDGRIMEGTGKQMQKM